MATSFLKIKEKTQSTDREREKEHNSEFELALYLNPKDSEQDSQAYKKTVREKGFYELSLELNLNYLEKELQSLVQSSESNEAFDSSLPEDESFDLQSKFFGEKVNSDERDDNTEKNISNVTSLRDTSGFKRIKSISLEVNDTHKGNFYIPEFKPWESYIKTLFRLDSSEQGEGNFASCPFLLQYDIVRLNLVITFYDQTSIRLYAPNLVCSIDSDDAKNISQILTELNKLENDQVLDMMFHNERQIESLSSDLVEFGSHRSFKSLNTFVKLIEQVIDVYKHNLEQFKIMANHRLIKSYTNLPYDKVKSVSHQSLTWLSQNLNELYPVDSAHSFIKYQGASYIPMHMQSETRKKSFDTFENRVIVGFIRQVASKANKLFNEFKSLIGQQEEEISSYLCDNDNGSSNAQPIITFKQLQLDICNKELNSLQNLLNEVNIIYVNYAKLFNIRDAELDHFPRKAKAFQEVKPYAQVFKTIMQWYRFGEFSVVRDRVFLQVQTLDKLYEYYCLYTLLCMLMEKGFEPDKNTPSYIYHYQGVQDLYKEDGQVDNTYILRRGSQTITLYYQPLVFDNHFENNLFLFRTRSATSDKSEASFFAPDYVMKVSNSDDDIGNEDYLIFDAKFSSKANVLNKTMNDLTAKYVTHISVLNTKRHELPNNVKANVNHIFANMTYKYYSGSSNQQQSSASFSHSNISGTNSNQERIGSKSLVYRQPSRVYNGNFNGSNSFNTNATPGSFNTSSATTSNNYNNRPYVNSMHNDGYSNKGTNNYYGSFNANGTRPNVSETYSASRFNMGYSNSYSPVYGQSHGYQNTNGVVRTDIRSDYKDNNRYDTRSEYGVRSGYLNEYRTDNRVTFRNDMRPHNSFESFTEQNSNERAPRLYRSFIKDDSINLTRPVFRTLNVPFDKKGFSSFAFASFKEMKDRLNNKGKVQEDTASQAADESFDFASEMSKIGTKRLERKLTDVRMDEHTITISSLSNSKRDQSSTNAFNAPSGAGADSSKTSLETTTSLVETQSAEQSFKSNQDDQVDHIKTNDLMATFDTNSESKSSAQTTVDEAVSKSAQEQEEDKTKTAASLAYKALQQSNAPKSDDSEDGNNQEKTHVFDAELNSDNNEKPVASPLGNTLNNVLLQNSFMGTQITSNSNLDDEYIVDNANLRNLGNRFNQQTEAYAMRDRNVPTETSETKEQATASNLQSAVAQNANSNLKLTSDDKKDTRHRYDMNIERYTVTSNDGVECRFISREHAYEAVSTKTIKLLFALQGRIPTKNYNNQSVYGFKNAPKSTASVWRDHTGSIAEICPPPTTIGSIELNSLVDSINPLWNQITFALPYLRDQDQ